MPPRPRDWLVIALATVLGWILLDVTVVAASPEPALVGAMLASCIIAVGVAAVAGLVLGLHRTLYWLALLAAAGVAAFSFVEPSRFTSAGLWFPRATALLLACTGVTAWAVRRWRFPRIATGIALGASAAVLCAAVQGPPRLLYGVVVLAAAVALVGTRLPLGLRRLATTTAVMLPLLCVVFGMHRETVLPRPDRPLPAAAVHGTQPNLLFIVLDTVRADHLAPYGYERVTTPGIDAWVRARATRYTDAYSASSWTLPSHGSFFTGLFPSDHGADHSHSKDGVLIVTEHAQPLRSDVPTLAERLAAQGYQTGAIVGNCMYLAHALGVDRGFAHYDDRWGPRLGFYLLVQTAGFLPEVGHSVHRSAQTITDAALGWLARRTADRPCFLFVNYMDPHVPYIPPRPYDTAFSDEQPIDPYGPEKPLQALLYDRKLLYTDAHVTRLLQALDEQRLTDNTVVIITSDHGEAFGEHCFWKHDKTLYEEVVHVPLYVKLAGQQQGAVSDERTLGVDVFYMALHAVGLAAEKADTGTVVAELRRSPELAALVAPDCPVDVDRDLVVWMEGRVKWIVGSKGSVEAYDLAADPHEQHNLAVNPDQIAQAQAYAARWWQAHPGIVTLHRKPGDIDAETRERMRNLGY